MLDRTADVAGGLTGPLGGAILLDGGQLLIDGDTTGALQPGALAIEHGGVLAFGHNLVGGINIPGTFEIDSNGLLKVGNDLGGLTAGFSAGLARALADRARANVWTFGEAVP